MELFPGQLFSSFHSPCYAARVTRHRDLDLGLWTQLELCPSSDVLAVWLWVYYFTSLSLIFLIYKGETVDAVGIHRRRRMLNRFSEGPSRDTVCGFVSRPPLSPSVFLMFASLACSEDYKKLHTCKGQAEASCIVVAPLRVIGKKISCEQDLRSETRGTLF